MLVSKKRYINLQIIVLSASEMFKECLWVKLQNLPKPLAVESRTEELQCCTAPRLGAGAW